MTITCETCKETVHRPMAGPDVLGQIALQHLLRGDHVVFVGILGCACGAKLRAGTELGLSPEQLKGKVTEFMAMHREHEGD